jgi:hypothetical protein
MNIVWTLATLACTAVAVAAAGPMPGVMKVEVTGTLTGVTLERGPADDHWRLGSAAVRAAGRELPLDCAECVAARRELVRRYGNERASTALADPAVVVKGRLELRRARAAGGGKEVMTPVLVVESLSFVGSLE